MTKAFRMAMTRDANGAHEGKLMQVCRGQEANGLRRVEVLD